MTEDDRFTLGCPYSGGYHPVVAYLLHSYLYYNLDHSIIPDYQYDELCRWMHDNYTVLLNNYHRHMNLVDLEALAAGTGHHLMFKFPEDIKQMGNKIAGV